MSMSGNTVELSVLVNGRPVREYCHNGKVFIEARKGSNYTLKLCNNNPYRVMAIFSVDGLEVISGKPAGSSETGYIINAHDSIEVKGYRINNNEVSSFIFTNKEKSYAAEMGNKANGGVIGVRVFAEKQRPVIIMQSSPTWVTPSQPNSGGMWDVSNDWYRGTYTANSDAGHTALDYCASNCLRSADVKAHSLTEPQFDLGTGWGNKVQDAVVSVFFEIGNLVAEMEIFYASRQNLEKMGVELQNKKKIAAFPSAFGYCRPPENWRG